MGTGRGARATRGEASRIDLDPQHEGTFSV